MESERGSRFLFLRVFFTRTGIHFARKRSNQRESHETLDNRSGCGVRAFRFFRNGARRGWLGRLKHRRFRGLRQHGQQRDRLRRKWRGNVHQRNRLGRTIQYGHEFQQPNQYQRHRRQHQHCAYRHHWVRQPVRDVTLASRAPLILCEKDCLANPAAPHYQPQPVSRENGLAARR
jgi:hypothetical protein